MTKMRLLCRLGIHSWGVWGEKFSLPETKYTIEYQQRKCVYCGLVDERKIGF